MAYGSSRKRLTAAGFRLKPFYSHHSDCFQSQVSVIFVSQQDTKVSNIYTEWGSPIGEEDQLVECLLPKNKDRSLIPSTHKRKTRQINA